MVSAANTKNSAATARPLATRLDMPKELAVLTGKEEWSMFYNAFNTSTESRGYSNVKLLALVSQVMPMCPSAAGAIASKAEDLCIVVAFEMAAQDFCEYQDKVDGQLLHFPNTLLLQKLVDKLPANLKLE